MIFSVRHGCLMLLALAGLAACDDKKAQAPKPPPPMTVGVVTLKPSPVTLTTELPGRTSAFLTSDVRPQVSGIINKRIFVEGADVKAGQQLYQIDPATYQATYDSALATLQHNQAALVTAQIKAKRFKPLAAAQAVSKQDSDDAVAAAAEAVADIASAKAAVEQARINLAYTKVAAPISGRISRSAVTPGALVTSNQTTALATVTQLDPIYVDVTQPATTVLRLKREIQSGKITASGPDQAPVQLVLEDGTTYGRPGVLQFSEVTVDPTTGTVLLRALFPNPDHLLLPGLYVRAELREGVNDTALLVPQQGVSHNSHGDPTAMIVDKDNKVALRVLQSDRAVGDQWVVTSGLAPGDRVIVDGLQKIRPGAPVNPVEVDLDKPAKSGQ